MNIWIEQKDRNGGAKRDLKGITVYLRGMKRLSRLRREREWSDLELEIER